MKIEDLDFVIIGDNYGEFIDKLGRDNVFLLNTQFIHTESFYTIFNIDDGITCDYIIMLSSVDRSIMERSIIVADMYHKTILYVDKPDNALCSINIGSTALYMKRPTDGLLNDPIFRVDDASYELEQDIHMIKLAAIADRPNVNNVIYTKESIMGKGGLTSERFKELMSRDMMGVEHGSSKDKQLSLDRFQTIEPNYVIGRVRAVGDRLIFIKSNERFIKVFEGTADKELMAFMRYFGDLKEAKTEGQRTVENIRLVTWDIWYANELPSWYLESLQ